MPLSLERLPPCSAAGRGAAVGNRHKRTGIKMVLSEGFKFLKGGASIFFWSANQRGGEFFWHTGCAFVFYAARMTEKHVVKYRIM